MYRSMESNFSISAACREGTAAKARCGGHHGHMEHKQHEHESYSIFRRTGQHTFASARCVKHRSSSARSSSILHPQTRLRCQPVDGFNNNALLTPSLCPHLPSWVSLAPPEPSQPWKRSSLKSNPPRQSKPALPTRHTHLRRAAVAVRS